MSEAESVAAVIRKAIEALNFQYDEFRDAITSILTDPENGIQNSMFYPFDEKKVPWSYDMGLIIELLKGKGSDDLANELDNALKRFVMQSHFSFSEGFTSENPSYESLTKNVSFYLPRSEGFTDYNDDAFYNRFDWAAAAGFSTKWETIK